MGNSSVVLVLSLVMGGVAAGQAPEQDRPLMAVPLTVAESSGFRRSSRLDDVLRFLDELESLPRADRLSRSVFGETTEGRDLVAVTVREPERDRERSDAEPLRTVLVNANIHGGEIEGKVAAQILLREFAEGQHGDILETLAVTFVPVFNADGNDAISRRNRVSQNGPEGGVGRRPNAMGLDLNRDFVKLESPEVRALTKLVNELEPIAFMDLHTTNGSDHGYDLTYAPSLSPNADPVVDEYLRGELFPAVRRTLAERDGIQVFDYGNFVYPRRERGSRGERGDPTAWATYDSRPRFGTNLMGLRGIAPILSEAYSYLPYERRIEATRAFVLECLRELAKSDLGATQEGPDRGLDGGLGVDARLIDGEPAPVRTRPIGSVTVDVDPDDPGVQEGRRRVAGPVEEVREVRMLVRNAFEAARQVPVGEAFAILEPSDEVLELLRMHLGAEPKRVAEPAEVEARVFVVSSAERRERLFQGHNEVGIEGDFESRELTLPKGALVVRTTRLTAHLLHPESDDSLTTWNLFDDVLFTNARGDGPRVHPVVLLPSLPKTLSLR